MKRFIVSNIALTTEIIRKTRRDGFTGLVSGVSAAVWYRICNHLFFNRFEWWQRWGIHVLPVSPWSPVPDTRELDRRLWTESSELEGIELREDEQLRRLSEFQRKYGDQYAKLHSLESETAAPYQYYIRNGTFETVDGEIFYCMIREHTPDRIVQIGGGFSTRVAAKALDDGSVDCTVEVFEPYRDNWLTENPQDEFAYTGKWADDISGDRFKRLERGDILFVDSSHVLRLGNDVYTLLFEVIPQLSDGVLIHFHDIFLPSEYPENWVFEEASFLNEQYAVRSFLMFNDRVEVRWAGSYMHEIHPEVLSTTFGSYDPLLVGPDAEMSVPNSLWLRITKQ